MKYYIILSLLMLCISLSSCISSSYQIGPGVDTSRGQQISFGPMPYNAYPFGDIYIEFYAPANATYTFYIAWGTVEDYGQGYIQFELTDINDTYIKDVVITFSEGVYFHTEQLFTVVLSEGTYKLWIKPEFNDGTLMLWGYDNDEDSSTTYYMHPDYGWIEIVDIAWYAVYSTEHSPSPGQPRAVITDIWHEQENVYVEIVIWNWRNGTEVTVARYDEIDDVIRDTQTFIVQNVSEQTIIASFHEVKEGDYIVISGYDVNNNFYMLRLERFNKTIAPMPKTLIDTILEWFNTIYSFSHLVFAVVVSVLPYAGTFYLLALLGAFFECLRRLSINPFFDFFYRQYSILVAIASLALKIAEKAYQATKTIVDIFIKILQFLLPL